MEKEAENKFRVDFFDIDSKILEKLLEDKTTKKNLIWGTNNYSKHGKGFSEKDSILFSHLKRRSGWLIQPRVFKPLSQQKLRSKEMAEVFTPSWVCNQQNNLVDEAWLGHPDAFNTTEGKTWTPTKKVVFDKTKTWKDYVSDTRMEITCGEAPYITSRYDTVTGNYINTLNRIGLLDRKLRVISENTKRKADWIRFAKIACQSIYGFDFQGDNVFIARVNVLSDVGEFYKDKFGEHLKVSELTEFADIIDWNIFQMDGLKFVVPLSCHKKASSLMYLPGFEGDDELEECRGCLEGDNALHSGTYVKIKDWEKNKTMRFIDLGGGTL